jgi:putative hydrolase of the HAD superfamily
MINTVLLDLDGTMLDRENSLRVYFHRQVKRLAELVGQIPYMPYIQRYMELEAHGHGDKGEAFDRIEAEFGLANGSGAILLQDYHAHFPDICVPFPRLHQTLAECRRRGWKLGIVTNGRPQSQNPKIDGLGIRDYFDTILISATEGVRKPDAEIFNLALQRLDANAAQTVMVGDNSQADIAGAQGAGIKGIWLRDSYWPVPEKPDAIIDNLDELPATISQLS